MAVRRLAEDQPDEFAFTPDNIEWAKGQIAKFPEGRQASAVIPLLWRAQEQHDFWLPEPAIRYVADFLDMPHIRVLEIATFYTMFNLAPVGKYFVQLCGTTPCMLRGSNELIAVCERVIGPQRAVTSDGMFSWLEVECLGACCNAPMVQINQDYFEDLTAESFEQLLRKLKAGEAVKPGPQVERSCSTPITGPTTLLDPALYSKGGSAPKPANANKKTESKPVTEDKPSAKPVSKKTKPAADKKPEVSLESKDRPVALGSPEGGGADDLKKIKGIGPKNEEILNGLGIFHFHQIASWTQANQDWVEGYLNFPGRIDRENWIKQATELAETAKGKDS